jgi:hypothetical protein
MAVLLTVGSIPVGIQQIITSGSQFDGAVSTSTLTSANGMNKYATDTKGGLFNFEQTEPIVVHHILADFGVSVTWTVYSVNLDANGAIIAAETVRLDTGSGDKYAAAATAIILGPRQALQLITSGGASAAKVARVWATTSRGFDGG